MLFKEVKTKKIIIWAAIIIFAATAVVFSFLFFREEKSNNNEIKYYYYPENFDEDIFSNSHYLSLYREILFGTPDEIIAYSNENINEAPPIGKFFIDYFSSVINGQYEDFDKYFISGFFDEAPKFTKQMIYDISVTKNSQSTETVNSEECEIYNYYVSYKIYNNNGGFRKDIHSDSAKPQIYQIYFDKSVNQYKIYRILDIVAK